MRIVLAVSEKRISPRTVRWAEQMLQQSTDAELIIVHVSKGHTSFYQRSTLGCILRVSDAEREVVEALRTLVQRHFSSWPGRVRFRHEIGDPSQVILRVAREEHADLIVMGCHDRGWAERAPIGGVVRSVLDGADTDILLVR
jgi:nucleotide-binding universal stress UspA family protein